jgi:hypothetical protein
MDLREIIVGGLDWIHSAKDGDRMRTLLNTVINLLVP